MRMSPLVSAGHARRRFSGKSGCHFHEDGLESFPVIFALSFFYFLEFGYGDAPTGEFELFAE